MVPELDCENDLTNPIRLGPKNIGNKPRLMKITVKTEETKKKILSNVSRLNNSKTDPRKRIYINQDYTNKEREQYKTLRAELKDRTDKGEKNLIIRNMRIVTKTQTPDMTADNQDKNQTGQ